MHGKRESLSTRTKLILWVHAMRPKTLIAGISPVAIGTSFGFFYGSFHFFTLLMTLLTGLFLQIGTNLANDYFDFIRGADTEERIGPTRITGSGLVAKSEVLLMTLLFFGLSLISAIPLMLKGGVIVAFLMALAVLLGIAYTAGPYPLAYLGIADFIIVFFMGSVATGMTTMLQTGEYKLLPFIAGFAPGLISAAILTANNLRDQLTDKQAKKMTLVVRFGDIFGRVEYTLALIGATVIPLLLLFWEQSLRFLMPSLLFIPSMPLIKGIFQVGEPREYVDFLPKTALYLFIYTIVFCYSLII